MACFAELKFRDNETNTTGGEKIFLLPVIDKDVNLTIDDVVELISESDNEELKDYLDLVKVKYNTVDAIMERGVINVNSISSIDSSITANQMMLNIADNDLLKNLLKFSIDNFNMTNNIHIANTELINAKGQNCDGVLFKQGSLKKIQIDSKAIVNGDTFNSIINDEKVQNTLTHELMHFIADEKLESLNVNSIEYKTINNIYDKFTKDYEKTTASWPLEDKIIVDSLRDEIGNYDGIEKLQEFLSNAIGDPLFRRLLNQMKPIKRTEENQSLLDSFVGWLSKLVFGSDIKPSLMSDLMNVTSSIVKLDDKQSSQLVVETNADDIYNRLGGRTLSENVTIVPWNNLKDASIAIVNKGSNIVSTRIKNTNEHFGNPFSHDPVGKKQGLIKTESIKDAVESYIDWIIYGNEAFAPYHEQVNDLKLDLNELEERRQWVLRQLESGKLKGLSILYYKELGEPSHATALDYLINKFDWNTDLKSYNNETRQNPIDDTYNRLEIPFSKSTSTFKKSTADNISELSYISSLLEAQHGIKINLMTAQEIANTFDTEDANFSIHRAFIIDNQIYINTDRASVAEPLHEMSHLILTALKTQDYDLYETLINTIQTHPSYSMIAREYRELEGVNLDEEVFASVFGEFYRKVARSQKEYDWQQQNKGLFDRIMTAMKDFFSNLFGVKITVSNEELAAMPVNEVLLRFGNMVMQGRFANVNEGVLMSNELEGIKKKLIKEGLLNQMC